MRGAWIGRLVWLALHSHTRPPGAGVSPFAFGICSPSSRSSVRCEPAGPRPEGPHCAGLPGASFSLACYPTQPLARCVADRGQGPAAPSLALCPCRPVLLAASHLLPALVLWSCAQIVLSWSWCSDFSVLMSCVCLFLNMQLHSPLTRHVQKKLSGHPNIVQFCSAASIGKEESDTGQAEFLLLMELCRGEVPAARHHPAGGTAAGVSSPETRWSSGRERCPAWRELF